MKRRAYVNFVIANSFFARVRGLLGTEKSWGDDNRILVLTPCKSIHTFGMRYSLDIAFADRNGIVLRAEREVKPGRLLSCGHANCVLERPSSDRAWPSPNQRLALCFEQDEEGYPVSVTATSRTTS